MSVRERVSFALLGALFLLRLLATLRPTSWMWGLDSLADRSPALRLVGLALFAAVLAPPVGAAIVRALARAGRALPGRILFASTCVATLAVLWMLRSRNLMLGDAQTYISTIEKGMRAAGGAHREPLSQVIVTQFHALVGGALGLGGQGSFTATELILAVCALAVCVRLARRIAPTIEGRLIVFAAILLGGALQLFSGYAEFYGFAVTAVLFFALLGVRQIDEGGGLLAPALAFTLACLSHAQALFAAPTLVYLIMIGWKEGRRRDAVLAAAAVPIAVLIGLVLLRYPFAEIGREATRPGSFLPPFGAFTKRTAYGAFAPAHLAEILNAAILVAPALPAAIALGISRPQRGNRSRRATFLALLAVGPILFALVANPQLGMVRDWDIFALPVTVAALWAAAAGATRLPHLRPRRGAPAIAGAILATTLLHTIFWMSANHDPDPARERMRRVAANASFFGTQSLGEIWRYIGSADVGAGVLERAAASYRTAIASDPDDRMSYRMLAGIEIRRATDAGKGVEEGLAAYHALLDAGKAERRAYAFLGGAIAATTSKREDLALREARAMIETEPEHPELLAFRGDLLRRSQRFDEARASYEAALARDPSQPRARIGLACLAGANGDRAACEAQAREALERTPWSPQAQQFARVLRQPDALTPDLCRRYLYIQ